MYHAARAISLQGCMWGGPPVRAKAPALASAVNQTGDSLTQEHYNLFTIAFPTAASERCVPGNVDPF